MSNLRIKPSILRARAFAWAATSYILLVSSPVAWALNPARAITQYTRKVWTQEEGLPQDVVSAISQTSDGYLWLGTDEGLVRFDGYDFVEFNKINSALPSNSIRALFASSGGGLWIGTPGGLTIYKDGRFRTYTKDDGLPDPLVTSIAEDTSGAVWMRSGAVLSSFHNGVFRRYRPSKDLPLETVRTVYVNHNGQLYVAGFGGVVRLDGNRFVQVVARLPLDGGTLIEDHLGNLWIGGPAGVAKHSPDGSIRLYRMEDGLSDNFVRSLWEDRDGNIWAGTNGGLARFHGNRFVSLSANSESRDWVRCIYEDTAGDLWVGMNSGLNRFRDDLFTSYGVREGLSSDEPTTVFQDTQGRIWIGFHDHGLMQFGGRNAPAYTTKDGLPSDEVFSIREDSRGDLLIATRAGPSRLHDGHFFNYDLNDPHHRRPVYDFLEDTKRRLWIAAPRGLLQLQPQGPRVVIPGASAVLVLCETSDGSIWAGTDDQGLWRWKDGQARHYGNTDGLSSESIRSLSEDGNGTLWIGTLGGGLDGFSNGRFVHVRFADGSVSDNIAHVQDDGRGSLFLSTTRGIARAGIKELNDFISGKLQVVTPLSYGVADGLRSAQCAPGFPVSRGGTRTADGRMWFPTSRGLAVLNPNDTPPRRVGPVVHFVGVTVDGRPIPMTNGRAELPSGRGRIEYHYTSIYLSAPDQVRYASRMEGLREGWVKTVSRHISYNSGLPHGQYRFVVRGFAPDGQWGEADLRFDVLPNFYETWWFRALAIALAGACVYAAFLLRELQMNRRFGLVLNERARLAREIHDTLAQGFVGVASQLDAVAITLEDRLDIARNHLNLARKMVRHSLTEARRSVMDLRASALEGQDLPSALAEAAEQWAAGSPMQVSLDFSGEFKKLPSDMEQQLLRIAQEAVANSVKHSQASRVWIRVEREDLKLTLKVSDNGLGFSNHFSSWSNAGGHFGLLGMRERAKRIGADFVLNTEIGRGTEIEVKVPLA